MVARMKLLSISTSARVPSAALLLDDGRISIRSDESGKPHSVSLMALIDGLLGDADLSVSDIDAFCVDIGPGSFTGVRIGVSVVNALSFSTGKPIIAVSSLAALRHAAPNNSEVVCCMLDARNGNGYAAIYSGDKAILEPCACVQGEVLEKLVRDYEEFAVVGDCKVESLLDVRIGCTCSVDANLVLKEALYRIESLSVEQPTNGNELSAERPTAGVQSFLRRFSNYAVPMYLRPSQAERLRSGQ